MVKLNERPFYLSKPQEDWVRQSLEKLSVRQKIGQLFCVMGGDYPLGVLAEMIETQGVGSVLYRPAPAAEIRAEYAVLDQKAPVPLLKAANLEEGGAGAILDGTLFGWPMTVGATNNPDMVEKFARVCAAEGRSIGVNWTFSPVSDLSWNYLNPITNVRAYSDEFEKVRDFNRHFRPNRPVHGRRGLCQALPRRWRGFQRPAPSPDLQLPRCRHLGPDLRGCVSKSHRE